MDRVTIQGGLGGAKTESSIWEGEGGEVEMFNGVSDVLEGVVCETNVKGRKKST